MREPTLAKLFSVSPWERVSSLAPDAYAPSRGIELRPVSDEVAARVPQTRGYRYVVASNRVLLVGTSRIVVGVFAMPTPSERRTPGALGLTRSA